MGGDGGGDKVSGGYLPSLGMGIESLGRLVFLGIWGEVDMTGFGGARVLPRLRKRFGHLGDGDWWFDWGW